MKHKTISIVLLLFFCVPGILGEGLHLVLPHKATALAFNSESRERESGVPRSGTEWPGSENFRFDPSCPICQFCSLAKSQQVVVPILTAAEYIEPLVLEQVMVPTLLPLPMRSGRSPPLFNR